MVTLGFDIQHSHWRGGLPPLLGLALSALLLELVSDLPHGRAGPCLVAEISRRHLAVQRGRGKRWNRGTCAGAHAPRTKRLRKVGARRRAHHMR